MNREKRTSRRLIVGILSIVLIVWMWVDKDVVSIYASMTPEQALPMLVTSIAVSLLKAFAITAVILAAKRLISKIRRRKR